MAILTTVRCRKMKASLAFYTGVLDFTRVDGDDDQTDPSFSVLARDGCQLLLSSHRGDGAFGQAIVVTTADVDAVFRTLRARGLRTPGNPDAPQAVHEGPIDQSWGTREFYVDDPDGNTLRFTQGMTPASPARGAEAALRAAEERIFAAIQSRDVTALAAELTDDFVHAAIGGVELDRPSFLQAIQEAEYNILEIGGEHLRVRLLDDAATLSGVQRARVAMPDGTLVSGATAFVDVFVKSGDRWLLRHAVSFELPEA